MMNWCCEGKEGSNHTAAICFYLLVLLVCLQATVSPTGLSNEAKSKRFRGSPKEKPGARRPRATPGLKSELDSKVI